MYETPFGPTIRNLIELAGGVGGTGRLQAVLLGGAAGSFLSPSELDTPLTFEGTRAIGATLGSTTFGQVTAARDPRIVQLGLKLYY